MDYTVLLDRARDLNNERKFLEAIEILESIKEKAKEDIKWYYRYSYALLYTNQFKKAIDLLEQRILTTEEEYPFGYLSLGQLYYWQGRKVEAFQMVEKGLSKCKFYEPESVWEFEQTLKSMYFSEPFANPENWRMSVLNNDFEDYDEQADAQYRIEDSLKAAKELDHYFGNYERERVFLTLFINARLQPKHRHQFEDILDYELAIHKLGVLDGGGTLLDKDKRPLSSDIHLEIFADVKNWKEKVLEIILKNIALPKGSYLSILGEEEEEKEEERISVGKYEVLALGLDAQNLADEVYQNCHPNEILEKLESAFEIRRKFFQYFFYDMTTERTYLRFLGDSYEQMKKIIEETTVEMPLCENAIFVNETNLNVDVTREE